MAPDLVGRMLASGKAIPTAFSMPGVFGGGGTGAGLGATPAASAVSTFQQLLAKAFPSAGAAQGWMGNFSGAHGGAAATATDLRDKLAGDMFAQKYGRAATEDEWKARYYKGSFEGVEEGGLDATFGKPGTWATLISEKGKQEEELNKKLLDAFAENKTAVDTGNTLLSDIRDKITPAGAPPPPKTSTIPREPRGAQE
jgi:hypothetical protein